MTSTRFFSLAAGLLAALLPLLAWSQAPVFDRAQVVGAAPSGGGNSTVTALALDAQGNQYVAGTFTGTVSFGPTSLTATGAFPAGNQEAYVGKLDANGTWLWAVATSGALDDRATALAVDAQGNAYVGGWFDSPSLTLGMRTLNNSSNQAEAFVAKLDAQGNWLWARRAGGTGGDYVMGLALVGNTLHACGSFESVTADFGTTTLTNNYTLRDGGADIFLAQLDLSTGLWNSSLRTGGLGDDVVYGLATDATNNIYLTGSFSGSFNGTTSTFGNTVLTSQTGSSVPFVAKFNVGRGWRWAVAGDIGTSTRGGANGSALAVDGQGRVTVVGGFNAPSMRLGTTTLYATGPADNDGYLPSDAFVAQLDSVGAWRWAVQTSGPGNDGASAVAVDGFGNVTAVVGFRNTATFGPVQLTSSGATNLALVRLGSTGTWGWVRQSEGRSGKLIDNGAGQFLLAGTFGQTPASFGPFTLAPNPLVPSTTVLGTGFLARLSAGPLAATGSKPAADWAVYPNPARQHVDVSGLPPRAAVEVLDALGRRVAAGTTSLQGALRLALPPALPAGLYLVRSGPRCLRLLVA